MTFAESIKLMPRTERITFEMCRIFLVVWAISAFYVDGNVFFILSIYEYNELLSCLLFFVAAVLFLVFPIKYMENYLKSKATKYAVSLILVFFGYLASKYIFVASAAIYTNTFGNHISIKEYVGSPAIKERGSCKYSLNIEGAKFFGKRPCVTQTEISKIKAGQLVQLDGYSSKFGILVTGVVY